MSTILTQRITDRNGPGPVTALHIESMPEAVKTRIILAAMHVAAGYGDGDIIATVEDAGEHDANLIELARAVEDMQPLFKRIALPPEAAQGPTLRLCP